MKKLQVYYGSPALKDLRKARGMTVAQLAALIPCSERTVNRFEASNWTSNPQIAQRLAEVFSIPFQQLFISADQHFLDRVESTVPTVLFGAPYALYHYAVHRRALYSDKLSWDCILLGDYTNLPDVFSVRC